MRLIYRSIMLFYCMAIILFCHFIGPAAFFYDINAFLAAVQLVAHLSAVEPIERLVLVLRGISCHLVDAGSA